MGYITIALLVLAVVMQAIVAAERTSDNIKALKALQDECDGLRMEIRDAHSHLADPPHRRAPMISWWMVY